MILKRLHLRLGKKAMEKLMQPVEATWEGAEGGYFELHKRNRLDMHKILDAAA